MRTRHQMEYQRKNPKTINRPHLQPEAKLWNIFVKWNLMPTSHNQTVDRTRLVLINAIITGYQFNVGEVIAQEISAACQNDKGILAFPCSIFVLCKRALVPTRSGDKYTSEKPGWTRKEYMWKMEVADATPIQMVMPTPPASEQAEPSAPAGAQPSPAATPQATPATSPAPTPAATPATPDSRQSTPDSPLGSTPTPPARSEEAVPIHILQLRNQLQRIEARQLQYIEETKVFHNFLINFLCFQFPSATAFFHTQPTTTQPANFSASTHQNSTPIQSEGVDNTEKVNLSSDDENGIFDWHTPIEHHGPTYPTPRMADVSRSSTTQKSPTPTPTVREVTPLLTSPPVHTARRRGKTPAGQIMLSDRSSNPDIADQPPARGRGDIIGCKGVVLGLHHMVKKKLHFEESMIQGFYEIMWAGERIHKKQQILEKGSCVDVALDQRPEPTQAED
ncbi:hypothetical protein V6N13_074379 [Hibiscus sabdariffa]